MGRSKEELIKAVVLGHAVGDALGVPVEFLPRSLLDAKPVTDMEGFGTFPVPAGAWSDDTSMSLCALDALAGGAVDYDKVMVNFGRWYYRGEFTPTGVTFDVGNACSLAIDRYFAGKMPYDKCGMTSERSNGNGSLMRIHPFVLYTAYAGHNDAWQEIIHTASALTHAHRRSQVGCGIYAYVLRELLDTPSKEAVGAGLAKAQRFYSGESEAAYYARLFSRCFAEESRDGIRSSGYVVDTLEAAVWCLLTTDNFGECLLKAVNLGEDTDSVAGVAGGLAGALYGSDAIPEKWLHTLLKRDFIEELCVRAAARMTEDGQGNT